MDQFHPPVSAAIRHRHRLVRFIIPLSISAFILGFLVDKVDGVAIIASVRQCNLLLLLLSITLSVTYSIFLSAEKWRQVLISLGHQLPFHEILLLRTACIPFKVVFPMSSSELLKALYLNKQNRLSFNRSVSSLMFDKALNLFATIFTALIGLMFAPVSFHPYIIIILFLLFIPLLFFNKFTDLLVRLIKKVYPRLTPTTEDLVSAFRSISIQEKFILIAFSLFCKLLELVNYYILFLAVGITIPLTAFLFAAPVVMLISKVPLTTLGLGTREAAVLFFFAAYGAPTTLLSGSILISLVGHILPILIGIFSMPKFYQLSLGNQSALP